VVGCNSAGSAPCFVLAKQGRVPCSDAVISLPQQRVHEQRLQQWLAIHCPAALYANQAQLARSTQPAQYSWQCTALLAHMLRRQLPAGQHHAQLSLTECLAAYACAALACAADKNPCAAQRGWQGWGC
jgi:hypothetical protein